MNLDDPQKFAELDKSGMLAEIRNLPDQLEKAWKTAEKLPLPLHKDFSRVILAGMGGSAIGADILSAYIYSICKLPIFILRGYQLPAWASGVNDLVVCSSHSGNTEETLAVFEESVNKGCSILTISTGGKLFDLAGEKNILAWKFEHAGQPRAAVGFSFGMLLNLFSRLKLIPDQSANLSQAADEMRRLIEKIDVQIPATNNLAKRIAGQAMDRFPVIFGAEHLEPVARRWKTQMNEIAKGLAQFEFIPEADHNTLAGLINPEALIYKVYAVFLTSSHYFPRNQKRFELTASEFMLSGICIDKVDYSFPSTLVEIWNTILLGDFVSFYQAMAYGVDPTPVEALENLKKAMRESEPRIDTDKT